MKILGMGMPELLIILAVILLIFGPKNLPKLGSALGKTVKNLRDGMGSNKSIEEAEDEDEEEVVEEVEEEKPVKKTVKKTTTTKKKAEEPFISGLAVCVGGCGCRAYRFFIPRRVRQVPSKDDISDFRTLAAKRAILLTKTGESPWQTAISF